MLGNIYFDYYTNPITFQNIEKQIGGFRISRITKNNITNNKLEIEKYYYSPYNCLTCQSGSYINQAPIAYIRKIERYNLCETPTTRTLYSVGSSNLARIYSSQNAQFGYEFVTKSYGNNFENGSEESKYEIIQDGLPITIQGIVDNSTPLTNGFGAGRLVSFKVLNSTFKTLKETINLYEHNIAKDKTVNGYNSYRSQEPFIYFHGVGAGSFPECLLAIQAQNYSLSQYSLRSQWSYLKQSTESLYDNNGLNPITTIVNYNYNNPIHLQLTSQTTTNSKNETFETKYYYPHDLITEPFMQDLVTVNRIVPPISTEQYNGLTLLSKNKTVYAKDATTSNLLLSKNIYAAKFPNILPNIQYIGQLEKKITYDLYDNKGNILQYTPENGSPVAIIWGYNQSLPVAKIENATYAQANTAYTANPEDMALRNSLPASMITTYTYIPLIGISTITDPKGDKITYTYDSFGRLQFVKDKNGNILSENEYHYKN
jgi:YD repeat-containing protein